MNSAADFDLIDLDRLRALVRAHGEDALETWPLVIVRHAKALARSDWEGDDRERPLVVRGRERADALIPVLAAYGITRVLTSPSVRCLDTVSPYAVWSGTKPLLRKGLSEEGHEAAPDKALQHLEAALERGEPAAICSHGPVLPPLLTALSERLDLTGESSVETSAVASFRGAAGSSSPQITRRSSSACSPTSRTMRPSSKHFRRVATSTARPRRSSSTFPSRA